MAVRLVIFFLIVCIALLDGVRHTETLEGRLGPATGQSEKVCVVAEVGAACKSTYEIEPALWEAPCCDEDQGFECSYWGLRGGHFCSLINGWYPLDWVTKLGPEAAMPTPTSSTPYWKLAEAQVTAANGGKQANDQLAISEAGFTVTYGENKSQTLGTSTDWFAFADIWWSAPNVSAKDPSEALSQYAGGSLSSTKRYSEVNGLLAGRASSGKRQGESDPSQGVAHQIDALQYAVELAHALNSLGMSKPAGGRRLWRGGWYSKMDTDWIQRCHQEGLPLAHPSFMSTSLSSDHAKEFAHPMFCHACDTGACEVCPDETHEQVPVLFEIESKNGKELRSIADNLKEQEFIFLPHTPLRVVSVIKALNDPLPGKTEWEGRPLRGRLGRYGGEMINKHPWFYAVKLADFEDHAVPDAFERLQELRKELGSLSTDSWEA